MQFEYPEGATPLDPDEVQGLIPGHLRTQDELNTWESTNIADAELSIWRKKYTPEQILNEKFLRSLHKKMFVDTWRWAGQYRKSDKNIGVDWLTIGIELKNLFDDVLFQLDQNVYDSDEIAVRFHHRLTLIHPFPNGNGRHARLMADLLIKSLERPRFKWGASSLRSNAENRKAYIQALNAADKGNIKLLLQFVRKT